MITLFKKIPRDEVLGTIAKKYPNHEVIRFDDSTTDASEITHALSTDDLFGNSQLIFLSNIDRELWSDVISALGNISDSTVVFWAEDSFPIALIKGMPKHTVVETKEKKAADAEKMNPFQIANQLSAGNGTTLWATYQELIANNQAPEAIFGILWWKLKDIAKKKQVITPAFKSTLKSFMSTYSNARETGGELETGLEKLLLSISKKDI